MFLSTLVVLVVLVSSVAIPLWLSSPYRNTKTEAEIPEGCELVKIGSKYAFKIGNRFADFENICYTWTNPSHVQDYCLTRSKTKAIKLGIECYELFKATKYIYTKVKT